MDLSCVTLICPIAACTCSAVAGKSSQTPVLPSRWVV